MTNIADTIANAITVIISPFTNTVCMSKKQEAEHDAKIAEIKRNFKPVRLVGDSVLAPYERMEETFAKRKGMDM